MSKSWALAPVAWSSPDRVQDLCLNKHWAFTRPLGIHRQLGADPTPTAARDPTNELQPTQTGLEPEGHVFRFPAFRQQAHIQDKIPCKTDAHGMPMSLRSHPQAVKWTHRCSESLLRFGLSELRSTEEGIWGGGGVFCIGFYGAEELTSGFKYTKLFRGVE